MRMQLWLQGSHKKDSKKNKEEIIQKGSSYSQLLPFVLNSIGL